MFIKAIILFRLRAVGDFLFAFCSLINIDEAPVRHFKTKWYNSYTHSLKKLVILSPNGEKLTWKSLELRGKTVCPAIDRL